MTQAQGFRLLDKQTELTASDNLTEVIARLRKIRHMIDAGQPTKFVLVEAMEIINVLANTKYILTVENKPTD